MYFKFLISKYHEDSKKIIFKNLFLYNKQLTKHKFFEFQISYYFYSYFYIEFECKLKCADHAGPRLEISFLGYCFGLSIYDNRHWDYERNDWKST
jgi:hypothetical protein